MGKLLRLDMQRQPDDTTCGPTCLHAVYAWHGDAVTLSEVIQSAPRLSGGGSLAVLLAIDALKRGYKATLFTYDLRVYDPTWFRPRFSQEMLVRRLHAQAKAKSDAKLHIVTDATLEFLELGGMLKYVDLTPDLIEKFVGSGRPVLTGLSATYLYNSSRERPWDDENDDIRGTSAGHFVVLSGYDKRLDRVLVADPLRKMKGTKERRYWVNVHRLIGAILLGVLTYDGNLLLLEPPPKSGKILKLPVQGKGSVR